MAEFTPGPWKTIPASTGDWQPHVRVIDDTGDTLATVWLRDPRGAAEADARLIAAAPDMHEVCKRLIIYDKTDYDDVPLAEQIRQWDALVDLARAALARVK